MSKVERIGPDPEVMKQVTEVLAQSRKILEMNAHLLEMMLSPPIVYSGPAPDFGIEGNKSVWSMK